jgi:hypothetical protein
MAIVSASRVIAFASEIVEYRDINQGKPVDLRRFIAGIYGHSRQRQADREHAGYIKAWRRDEQDSSVA